MAECDVKKIDVGDGAAIPEPDDRGMVSAWWIALLGTIGLLIALPLKDPSTYGRVLTFIPDGILVTF